MRISYWSSAVGSSDLPVAGLCARSSDRAGKAVPGFLRGLCRLSAAAGGMAVALRRNGDGGGVAHPFAAAADGPQGSRVGFHARQGAGRAGAGRGADLSPDAHARDVRAGGIAQDRLVEGSYFSSRSEEHTSELQSLMRI